MHGRLFFGFEYHYYSIYVIALDPTGHPVLRVTFPLHDPDNANLKTGPAADLAASLLAFVHAHDALPVCGTDDDPTVLAALARHLGGTVRSVSDLELEHTARPGFPLGTRRTLGTAAHQRALIAALAVAEDLGSF